MGFEKELESLLNKYSQENGSDTPDFILAKYLNDCLTNWNHAVSAREKWYGRGKIGAGNGDVPVRNIGHGFSCRKVEHTKTGYLHGSNDDTPYDVDGASYCGRCHMAL